MAAGKRKLEKINAEYDYMNAAPVIHNQYSEDVDNELWGKWHKRMKTEDEKFWNKKRPNGKKPPRYASLTGNKKAPANIIRDTSRFLDGLVDQSLDWRPLYRLQLLRQEIVDLYSLIDTKPHVTRQNIEDYFKGAKGFTPAGGKSGKGKAKAGPKMAFKPAAVAAASPPPSPAKLKTGEKLWKDPNQADEIMIFLRSVVYALSNIHFATRYYEDLSPGQNNPSLPAIFETGQVLDAQTRWALAAQDAFSYRWHMIHEVTKRLVFPPEFNFWVTVGSSLASRRHALIHDKPFRNPLNYYGPIAPNLTTFVELGNKLVEIFNYLCDIYPKVVCEEIKGITLGTPPKDLKAFLIAHNFDMKGWGRNNLHDSSDLSA